MPVLIESLTSDNTKEVLHILAERPLENITLIADCTQLLDWCDVRILRDDGDIKAVFSVYSDLDFVATAFWSESTHYLNSLMDEYRDRIKGSGFVAICTQNQLDQLAAVSTRVSPVLEKQMYADCDTKLQCECESEPVRVTLDHSDELKELYRVCGTPAWTPSALELGPFYAIITENSEIVSVAGVHYMTQFGSEIGNVATHPAHRRKGYAEACIKSVAEDVLQSSDLVILHYFADNLAAQKLYERMGFSYSPVDPIFFVRAEI